MKGKYTKYLILIIEIILATIITKFFQNMVYTDIILIILTLGISFYIALHYETEIKNEKKWIEFEKNLSKKLENQNQKLEDLESFLTKKTDNIDSDIYRILSHLNLPQSKG